MKHGKRFLAVLLVMVMMATGVTMVQGATVIASGTDGNISWSLDSDGKLTPVSKARGMKQALSELVTKMYELGNRPLAEQTVFICHADAPDSVAYVKAQLKERLGVTDVRDDYIGPVIGSHTGAGTLGLFFFGKER